MQDFTADLKTFDFELSKNICFQNNDETDIANSFSLFMLRQESENSN